MSVTHELRNWLHQLLLAAQVGHVGMLALNFAPDVEVAGPGAEDRWSGHEQWSLFLQAYFATLQIGDLNFKLLDKPTIMCDSEQAHTATLHWHLWLHHAGRGHPLTLDCTAWLERVEGRWVAHRLEVRLLPP